MPLQENLNDFHDDLFCAAQLDCVALIDRAFERLGLSISNIRGIASKDNVFGETPLLTACARGNLDVAKHLIGKYGVDVNQRGTIWLNIKRVDGGIEENRETNGTALHAAVLSGNLQLIHYLINVCKANVNAITSEILLSRSDEYTGGFTPLHLAVVSLNSLYGMVQCEVIRCLLAYGADWNICDITGKQCWELTPDVDLAKFLIYFGIGMDPGMNTTLSTVAHHWARVNIEHSSEVVELAITEGIDINQPDAQGLTPLMIAALGDNNGCPNEDVFQLILTKCNHEISRLDEIAAYELIGATFIIFDNVDKGLQYWKKAMELRFEHQQPIPKTILELSASAYLAFQGVSEVQTLQELEELAYHDLSSLKIQALLTSIRILGLKRVDIYIRLFSYSISIWTTDKQNFLECSKFMLESFNVMENVIWELSCAIIFLSVFTVHYSDRFSITQNNYDNAMPILRKLVDILQQIGNSSANFENHELDNETFVLIFIIYLLDVMVSSVKLNSSQEQELKCCLHAAVLVDRRDSNGNDLLLLACVPQSFKIPTASIGEITAGQRFLRLRRTISAEVISLLLEVGANPNSTNNEGDTGLHILARHNETFKSDSVRVLERAGTHVDRTNLLGETAKDVMSGIPHNPSTEISLNPLQFQMLKCMCARVIRRSGTLEFQQLPPDMAEYIGLH